MSIPNECEAQKISLRWRFCSVRYFWSFAFIFFFCEFGERLSNGFRELNDMCYQLDLYLFPIEIRPMLPTILVVAQQPVLPQTRDVFKQVSSILVYCCVFIPILKIKRTQFEWECLIRVCSLLVLKFEAQIAFESSFRYTCRPLNECMEWKWILYETLQERVHTEIIIPCQTN